MKKRDMNNYFPHDSNARNSDKLLPLRMKYGAEGYGIYFMLLERLREEQGYMSVKDYNMLAFDLRVDSAKVKSVIEDFGLFVFTDEGKYFYSEGFKKRMEIKDETSAKLSDAGKRGNAKRWNKNQEKNASQSPPDSLAIASQSQVKERKGNISSEEDIKENTIVSKKGELSLNLVSEEFLKFNKWLEETCPFVLEVKAQMREREYNKLTKKYTKKEICDVLESLNNWRDFPKKRASVYRSTLDELKKKFGER